jgi:hypothetical protein
MEESCSVGKKIESKCKLKHYSLIAESIPLCNLTLDEQRVIKLRVKSENISFICRRHLIVFLTYYDRIWKKSLCCDPYSKHGNKSVNGDKTISLEFSDQIFCATNSLMRLIPGEKICPLCNKLLNEVIERGYLTPESLLHKNFSSSWKENVPELRSLTEISTEIAALEHEKLVAEMVKFFPVSARISVFQRVENHLV